MAVKTMARTLAQPGPSGTPRVRDLEKLGQVVRNERLKQQMRIDDVASTCGVAVSVLSRLENGQPVQSDNLFKVLHGLGICVLMPTDDDAREFLNAKGYRFTE